MLENLYSLMASKGVPGPVVDKLNTLLVDQFEEMLDQSERPPLVFSPALHGFNVGQPHRMRNLRRALQHCLQPKYRERLWITSGGAIADYRMTLAPGIVPGGPES